jgi:hypothetical protein
MPCQEVLRIYVGRPTYRLTCIVLACYIYRKIIPCLQVEYVTYFETQNFNIQDHTVVSIA